MSHAIQQAKLPRRRLRGGRLGRRAVQIGRRAVRAAGPGVRGILTRPARRARRRGRGISATELRGFKKVARLLADFGMAPRGLRRAARRPGGLFRRR